MKVRLKIYTLFNGIGFHNYCEISGRPSYIEIYPDCKKENVVSYYPVTYMKVLICIIYLSSYYRIL